MSKSKEDDKKELVRIIKLSLLIGGGVFAFFLATGMFIIRRVK